jgi:hypothetical protein
MVMALQAFLMQRASLPGCHCILNRSGSASRGAALVGPAPAKPVSFRENGLAFAADLVAGQKTGFFLDQRDNRSWMQVGSSLWLTLISVVIMVIVYLFGWEEFTVRMLGSGFDQPKHTVCF